MLPLVSIVIPVYNTSKEYLKRCFEALYKQSYTNWECVFVDNGSNMDYSDVIADKRFQYTRLEHNQGIFLARKHGVLNAKGDYIIFCDSDDWIASDLCQRMIDSYQEDIDVYITKTTSVFESGRREFSLWANTGLGKAEKLGFFEALSTRQMIPWTIWGKVIKKSVLLRAYENLPNTYPICMGEDFLLTSCYGYHVNKSKYLPFNGYFHVMNSQSTSLSISRLEKLERHLGDMSAVIPLLEQYFLSYNVSLNRLSPLKKELLASFLVDVPKFSQNEQLYTEILPKLSKIFGETLVYGAFVESYAVRADALYWNFYKVFSKIFPKDSKRHRALRSISHFFVKGFKI